MPLLAALASAGLLILATPPIGWWPLAFAGLVPLLLALRRLSPARAAALGWLTGLVYCGVCYGWWSPTLQRTAQLSAPLALLFTVLIAAWQGLVYALWAGAVTGLRDRFGLSPLLTAPLCIALAETAVPYFFKAYLSITVWQVWPVVQVAELGGPMAVSALVTLANAVAAEAVTALYHRRLPPRATTFGALVLLVAIGAGSLRGAQVANLRQQQPAVPVGLVHLSGAPDPAATPEQRRQALFQAAGRATAVLFARGAKLVAWPEGAWPGLLPREAPGSPGPRFLRTLVAGFDGHLLVGALTGSGEQDQHGSAVLVTSSGQIAGYADKNRLVPFMEYLPFAQRFPGLVRWLAGPLSDRPPLRPGAEPPVLVSGPFRLGILFCSEELLTGYSQALARRNPNLLVGLASDLWVRDSWAPAQHTAAAAFRAVEARRDLVHVTELGISALVDASGRVRLLAPPEPVSQETATALMGDAVPLDLFTPGPYIIRLFPLGCLLVLAVAAWRSRRRQPRQGGQ